MAKEKETKPEVKVEGKAKRVERNLQSIDYRKSSNQPITTPEGVVVSPFKTDDDRRGVSIIDVKTGKVLCLAGIGKTGKFYAITEVTAIQWTKEQAKRQAVAV